MTTGTQTRRARRAHPRSRGENLALLELVFGHSGSSPLTRGKPDDQHHECQHEGLIPAHAGKTDACVRAGQAHRAHPRSRGENTSPGYRTPPGVGSSPLTRGKPPARCAVVELAGLIPAHAGKTSSVPPFPRTKRGSSPLTRGKRELPGRGRVVPGLIPAHAGKTSAYTPGYRRFGAHPRSRGENRNSPRSRPR